METHKNLLDNMEHWLQQDASLLAMTNEVDYDQDGEYSWMSNIFWIPNIFLTAYAQQLEDMIAEKQEALEALREKTRAFRFVILHLLLYFYMCVCHIFWMLVTDVSHRC